MTDRVYNAIILNEPYASKVKERIKTIETRMRRLSKLVGDIVICCDKGKSAGSQNAGKALCIVTSEGARIMTDDDEKAACIECVSGRYAYPLKDWRYFSYDFKFTDYAITKNWQGIFQIRIPDFVTIIPS